MKRQLELDQSPNKSPKTNDKVEKLVSLLNRYWGMQTLGGHFKGCPPDVYQVLVRGITHLTESEIIRLSNSKFTNHIPVLISFLNDVIFNKKILQLSPESFALLDFNSCYSNEADTFSGTNALLLACKQATLDYKRILNKILQLPPDIFARLDFNAYFNNINSPDFGISVFCLALQLAKNKDPIFLEKILSLPDEVFADLNFSSVGIEANHKNYLLLLDFAADLAFTHPALWHKIFELKPTVIEELISASIINEEKRTLLTKVVRVFMQAFPSYLLSFCLKLPNQKISVISDISDSIIELMTMQELLKSGEFSGFERVYTDVVTIFQLFLKSWVVLNQQLKSMLEDDFYSKLSELIMIINTYKAICLDSFIEGWPPPPLVDLQDAFLTALIDVIPTYQEKRTHLSPHMLNNLAKKSDTLINRLSPNAPGLISALNVVVHEYYTLQTADVVQRLENLKLAMEFAVKLYFYDTDNRKGTQMLIHEISAAFLFTESDNIGKVVEKDNSTFFIDGKLDNLTSDNLTDTIKEIESHLLLRRSEYQTSKLKKELQMVKETNNALKEQNELLKKLLSAGDQKPSGDAENVPKQNNPRFF